MRVLNTKITKTTGKIRKQKFNFKFTNLSNPTANVLMLALKATAKPTKLSTVGQQVGWSTLRDCYL
jgi:hypothetical protein